MLQPCPLPAGTFTLLSVALAAHHMVRPSHWANRSVAPLDQWVWLLRLQARANLAGRETELTAMRARVALQNSYIEKLEDEQSGFTGALGIMQLVGLRPKVMTVVGFWYTQRGCTAQGHVCLVVGRRFDLRSL
jgi:hypothetical protein